MPHYAGLAVAPAMKMSSPAVIPGTVNPPESTRETLQEALLSLGLATVPSSLPGNFFSIDFKEESPERLLDVYGRLESAGWDVWLPLTEAQKVQEPVFFLEGGTACYILRYEGLLLNTQDRESGEIAIRAATGFCFSVTNDEESEADGESVADADTCFCVTDDEETEGDIESFAEADTEE